MEGRRRGGGGGGGGGGSEHRGGSRGADGSGGGGSGGDGGVLTSVTLNQAAFLSTALVVAAVGAWALWPRVAVSDAARQPPARMLLPSPHAASHFGPVPSAEPEAPAGEHDAPGTPYFPDDPPPDPRWVNHPYYVSTLAEGLRRGGEGNPGGVSFITMVNAAWREMLEHMMYSAIVYGNITSFLVVALDDEGMEACLYNTTIKMPCYNGARYAGDLSGGSEKLLDSPEYVRVTWARPKLVMDLLYFNTVPGIVNVDTDIVFFKPINPLVEAECSRSSLFSCSCELDWCNMGFYLIRPAALTRDFWRGFVEFEDSYFNDQEMYQRIEHLLPDVQKCCLSMDLFRNSCVDPHSVLPETNAIMVHTICMTGLNTKKTHLMWRKGWFFPDDPADTAKMLKRANRMRLQRLSK